jgi:hypothetical protein
MEIWRRADIDDPDLYARILFIGVLLVDPILEKVATNALIIGVFVAIFDYYGPRI